MVRKIKQNISLVLFVGFCLVLGGCGQTDRIEASAKKQPNILFIAVDDLRPELACYGNSYVISPHIDQLARDGVIFTQAHCQSAVCNPSRASLLTGMRPDTIKVWDLQDELRITTPDVITLPQYFMQKGYHSICLGKVFHNIIPDEASWSEPKLYIKGFPFDPDAVYRDSENLAYQEQRKKEITAQGKQAKYIDQFGQWYLKATATEIVDQPDNTYYDGAQTDLAVKKLAEFKKMDKPFFFAVGYYRPHLPFNAPKKYWDMYRRQDVPLAENPFVPKDSPAMAINNLRELRGYTDFKTIARPGQSRVADAEARRLKHGYLACVSYIDAQIGRLLAELDALGMRDDTIVVLWGDHGWKLGEHGSWCKMTNYEIDTRVPLIISTPKTMGKKIQCNQLVEFVDVYPTLCDLAGLSISSDLEGTSLVPLMTQPNRPWKQAVFSQFLREGIWKAPDGKEYMGYAIRTERYRYVEWMNWETKKTVAYELYDHQTDPQENTNIAAHPDQADVVKKLAAQLKAGWRAAKPIE